MLRDFSEKAKQKIIDKNNATKKKIDTIFSNVQSVDTESMAAMNRQITCGNNIIKLIFQKNKLFMDR